jgi:hypothetical protein
VSSGAALQKDIGRVYGETLEDLSERMGGKNGGGPQPVVTINCIEGRMMEALPFSPSYYEPPGMDFFG